MCGICGLASDDPRKVPLEDERLRAMTDVIEHRGPDEDGYHLAPGVAMGMRRLSIIDLAGSSQPIANEERSVWTVFNGEIYNFPELRAELEGKGHRLATHGDTEVIVHLYEEHGPRFAERLRGMFAIALWDESRRRLVLARDRMGVKPLYLAERPDGLAFASEVKALIAGGLVDPELDPMGAELFMAYGYVPGPHTLFKGVRKLMPASVLVWQDGRLAEKREY
jgi:asparagine synthase (glutamine-hydrolysing)